MELVLFASSILTIATVFFIAGLVFYRRWKDIASAYEPMIRSVNHSIARQHNQLTSIASELNAENELIARKYQDLQSQDAELDKRNTNLTTLISQNEEAVKVNEAIVFNLGERWLEEIDRRDELNEAINNMINTRDLDFEGLTQLSYRNSNKKREIENQFINTFKKTPAQWRKAQTDAMGRSPSGYNFPTGFSKN